MYGDDLCMGTTGNRFFGRLRSVFQFLLSGINYFACQIWISNCFFFQENIDFLLFFMSNCDLQLFFIAVKSRFPTVFFRKIKNFNSFLLQLLIFNCLCLAVISCFPFFFLFNYRFLFLPFLSNYDMRSSKLSGRP